MLAIHEIAIERITEESEIPAQAMRAAELSREVFLAVIRLSL